MKKRIALVAAIAMAIAVGGSFPAFAAKPAAPSVASDSCARAAGTVEIKSDLDTEGDGSVALSVEDGALVVAGDVDCSAVSLSWTGLTSVIVKAEGDVSFDLEAIVASAGSDLVANYHSVAFTVSAGGALEFDGSGLGSSIRPVDATVTEEAFTVGTLVGTYYAAELVFQGSEADDTFDASTVTTTPVDATGNGGADTLKGGAESDTLTGYQGNDVLYGNDGDDTLNTNDSGAAIPWSPGSSPMRFKRATGASGSDEAWGGAGNDMITGDAGDTVAPGDGTDEVSGNVDALVYSDSSAGVTINLVTKNHYVTSTAGNDYFSGSPVKFVGSELADTFVGNDSANVFYGGSGADVIVMNGGADFASGNGGTDAIKMGDGDDVVYGDTGADKINGGLGDDDVRGMGGDDVLYGSVGDDLLLGGKGSDQTWGGRGTDNCAGEVADSCEFTK